MSAPLYDALRALAARDDLRMHMPGHKGRLPFAPELDRAAALDYTELTSTGNLYEGGGIIGAAEALYAEAFGMAHAQFLTGGSTQGIFTALFYAARLGKTLLLCRGSHFSAYNACALLGLQPRYLAQPPLFPFGCCGPVTAQSVDEALSRTPAASVLITSPTYYGVCSDLSALGAVCRRHGALLIVDGAHGAHLPFLPGWETSMQGADILISSAHKTLPALGQSALLFSSGRVDAGALRRASALFGTSSPSYTLMAGLDAARDYMCGPGSAAYLRAAQQLERLRRRLAANTPFACLSGPGLDPLRFVVCCATGGISGLDGAAALEAGGIVPEMADLQNILCIVTGQDSGADFSRLESALLSLAAEAPGVPLPQPEAMPDARAELLPSQALFAPRQRLPLSRCAGRTAGECIIVYPPGIPILAPGEIIEEKHLAYLHKMRYNMDRLTEVLSM